MGSYHITEPHPSVPSSHYFHSGRGGAGNVTQVDPSQISSPTTATGPASAIPLHTNPSAYVAVGRGGAGNFRHENERAIFSFDEELERQRKLTENAAPVYMTGRGGAGNCFASGKAGSVRSSQTGGSDRSGRKSLEGAWSRVKGSFSGASKQ
ncbi:hypothetical protein P152DRAFT_457829 [Eremomyces bilateralis CBS 781.70]|uniref:Uncharacterized protein n=1 Tax=Eremomyces bilateralis CBS 781.70 TaxID=1392243 RepID=A0A6G1G5X0_9PEZI|nr:uncharacterized protein P152DRAFT_457829 [Eremomyces bilateralis CBS 781.70]KAF1813463.1 hypothetical protein P152DRAFT_457829 [Eremomyces bilateralis CBS 781.70]